MAEVKIFGARLECVEIDPDAMVFARQIFGLAQQFCAQSLVARLGGDVKLRDIEPAPVNHPAQAAEPGVAGVARLKAKGFFVARAKILRDLLAERRRDPRRGQRVGGARDPKILGLGFSKMFGHGFAAAGKFFGLSFAVWALLCAAASAGSECDAPAPIAAALDGPLVSAERIENFHPLLRACRRNGENWLAIRAFRENGEDFLLLADPEKLTTKIGRAACFDCVDAKPEAQRATRLFRALDAAAANNGKNLGAQADWQDNAGLIRGQGDGIFLTGDLCPSKKPLDRGFLTSLEQKDAATPIALSVSGLWILRHAADFQWLRREKFFGRLDVTFVNHSFHHPYRPGLADRENFLLTPGVDFSAEVLEVERLLIANGETPSLFFRFPGLISRPAQMAALRELTLIPLGAQAWLALSGAAAPGAIVLVHPNGNEPFGLSVFNHLAAQHRLPRPLRPLSEAP